MTGLLESGPSRLAAPGQLQPFKFALHSRHCRVFFSNTTHESKLADQSGLNVVSPIDSSRIFA
ncbi:hypothetical protein [Collimonas pratensis]|uniref:Uncharacterized protein n=1 Tax=Collimonas pratensis TaxID=279113 RepID=A0A127Q2H0_9BURK|nr:hypothetical protein [Collimonas pratensis]AMP04186.1 hypothetical protein CPter91_1813 [Collimonas pratensis]